MDDADDDFIVIQFVCTDHGQHPETKLGTYSRIGPLYTSIRGHRRLDSTLRGRKRRAANSEIVNSTVQLECPRCGRTPQLSPQALSKLADGHISKLDVSMLPF